MPFGNAKKSVFSAHFDALAYFCRSFQTTLHANDMENIPNARGKAYCLLYLFMGIFFFVALVLMLYYRNFVMEFPK